MAGRQDRTNGGLAVRISDLIVAHAAFLSKALHQQTSFLLLFKPRWRPCLLPQMWAGFSAVDPLLSDYSNYEDRNAPPASDRSTNICASADRG